MHFHIISLFPDSLSSYLDSSILKKAKENKKIKINFYNPRDYSKDRHKKVDHKPYGGGPGMVIQALPVIRAMEKALGKKDIKNVKMLYMSPGGKQFNNRIAEKIALKSKHVIIICGRYEGIDARIKKAFPKMEEISVGPYILTGGELPALVIIDSISRRLKGVLGNSDSKEEERVASHDVYTRPASFKYKNKILNVPKVLISGNHKDIDNYRKKRLSKVSKSIIK